MVRVVWRLSVFLAHYFRVARTDGVPKVLVIVLVVVLEALIVVLLEVPEALVVVSVVVLEILVVLLIVVAEDLVVVLVVVAMVVGRDGVVVEPLSMVESEPAAPSK